MFVDVEVIIEHWVFSFLFFLAEDNFAALFPFARVLHHRNIPELNASWSSLCVQRVSGYLPQKTTAVHMSYYLLTALHMWVRKKSLLLKSEYYVLHTDLTSAIAGLGQQRFGSPGWCHRAWSNSVARWLNHTFSFNLGVIKRTELLSVSF